jgi:hypothetical protein
MPNARATRFARFAHNRNKRHGEAEQYSLGAIANSCGASGGSSGGLGDLGLGVSCRAGWYIDRAEVGLWGAGQCIVRPRVKPRCGVVPLSVYCFVECTQCSQVRRCSATIRYAARVVQSRLFHGTDRRMQAWLRVWNGGFAEPSAAVGDSDSTISNCTETSAENGRFRRINTRVNHHRRPPSTIPIPMKPSHAPRRVMPQQTDRHRALRHRRRRPLGCYSQDQKGCQGTSWGACRGPRPSVRRPQSPRSRHGLGLALRVVDDIPAQSTRTSSPPGCWALAMLRGGYGADIGRRGRRGV